MFESLLLLTTLIVTPPFTAKAEPNYAVTGTSTLAQYYAAITLENQTPRTISLHVDRTFDPDKKDEKTATMSFTDTPGSCPEVRNTAKTPEKIENLKTMTLTAAATRCLSIGPLTKSAALVFWSTAPDGVQRVPVAPSPIQLSPPSAAAERVGYWPPFQSDVCGTTTKSTLTSAEGRTLQACTTDLPGEASGKTVAANLNGWVGKYSGTLAGVTTANGEKVTATIILKHHWIFAIVAIVIGLLFAAWREFHRTVAPAAIDLAEKAAGLPTSFNQVGPYALKFDLNRFLKDTKKRMTFLTFGPTPTLDTLEQQRAAAASWFSFESAYSRLVTPLDTAPKLPVPPPPANTTPAVDPPVIPPLWYEDRFAGYVPMGQPANTEAGVVKLLNDLARKPLKPLPAPPQGTPASVSLPHTIASNIEPADFPRALSLMRDAATIAGLIGELTLAPWKQAVTGVSAVERTFVELERVLYNPSIEPGPNLSAADMSAYARRLSAHYDRFLAALALAKAQQLAQPATVLGNVLHSLKTKSTTASTGGIASGRSGSGDNDDELSLAHLGRNIALWRSQRGALLLWSALTLAVVAGLQALYFKDAPWGSAWDYVVALTWGSLVYTGLSSLTDALGPLRDPLRKTMT